MFNTNNKRMLWAVKLSVTAFNIPDTVYAYLNVFSDTNRQVAVAAFSIIMAIVTIDLVFLWVLSVLESDLETSKKLPFAFGAILFTVFSVWIGVTAEKNILAFVPRIGLILVVFIYISSVVVDFYKQYFSREEIEKRIRNARVIKRQNIDKNMYKKVLREKGIKELFKDKHRRLICEQLGEKPERSEEKVVDTRNIEEELPEHVFVENGVVGWQSPFTHEIFLKTSTDKPYTIRGAQIAASRHIAEMSKNGHG